VNVEVTIPDLSTTDATVMVVRWLVEPGETVQRGEPLLEVETDKATMEVEAYVTGVLRETLALPDTVVEVGQVIAVIETEETGVSVPGSPTGGAPEARSLSAATPVAPSAAAKRGGMFARNRQRAVSAEARPPIPLSAAQRTVARRMQESSQTVPHYYLQTSANAELIIAQRNAASGEKPVWDAFFAHAAGRALKQFDRMGARFSEGQLIPAPVDAVGVAVDVEDELYVIQITDPASKAPSQISREIRATVQRLREGDTEAMQVRPSSMTITNLGATGVESFTAIINPPEAAILAVGKVARAVVALEAGGVAIQHRVSLTLSVDHRVANGRYAARFLGCIVAELEALGGDRP
jgi:pyruvate dehydrogenase E2 component (dihydrolipoamide acetyltransferase)